MLGAVGGSAVSESSPPKGGLPSEREEEEDEEETLTADDCESSISGISDLLQGSVLGRVEDLLDDGRDANQPEATHPEMEGEGEGGGAALSDCVLLSTSLDRPVELRLADKGAGSEPPVTVVQLFQQAAERHAGRKALCVKRVGVWKSWTYQRYQEESVALAKAFIKVRVMSGLVQLVQVLVLHGLLDLVHWSLVLCIARFGAVGRGLHPRVQLPRVVHHQHGRHDGWVSAVRSYRPGTCHGWPVL